MQAAGGPAVSDHDIEQTPVLGPDRFGLVTGQAVIPAVHVEQPPARDYVTLIPEQGASGGLPVASGPARLLVVSLDALRHIVVYHISHIGLVNAHTEGVGGYNHLHLVVDEVPLRSLPVLGIHACVVAGGTNADLGQVIGQGFGLLTGGAVDDARFVLVLPGVPGNPTVLVFGLQLDHIKEEVGTIEPRHSHVRVVQAQHVYDVATHLLGGRGGEGRNRRPLRKGPDEVADTQVGGTEVLSPLGYTVSLVHSQEGYPHTLGEVPEPGGVQPFGGHI